MKPYRINLLLIVLLLLMTFKIFAIDEVVNLNSPQGGLSVYGSDYVDDMNMVWNINVGENKPILIDISYDLEYGSDYVFIYSVSNNNVETLIATLTGSGYDTISTIVPTGKAKVVFYSDSEFSFLSPQGYTGFEAFYWVDNTYNSTTTQNNFVAGDLTVVGNSYLQGKVGIGTLSPEANLDVRETFKLNRSDNLIDNYNTIGGDFILAPNPYSLSNNGYLKIGYPANNIIRFGTDYDGNVGAGIWKDIQFGRHNQPYLTIKDGGNIGIGTANPNKIMQISKTDNTVNLSLNNQSALELWNPIGSLNTGAQINFRSDNAVNSGGIGAVIGYLNKGSNTSGSCGNIVFGVKSSPSLTVINPAMVIQYNGNVGIGIDTPQVKLHLNNDGAILAQGAYGSGWNETNLGTGTRMLWYPRKAAFRVGHVNGTQWDNNNIGNYSFANGFNTISSGTSSVAMGHDSKATNSYAIAMGMQATASNMSALAFGYQTTASGKYSTTMGYVSRATGEHSLAMGKWVNATETNSMVIGLGASSQDRLVNNTPNSLIIGFNTTNTTLFVGSKVGIGTNQPDCELTVNGVIHAKEIKIDLNTPLADYVFSPDYSLMPLYEVENFVKTNQHLPEIPSAVHVKDNGLHLGEMQNKLLQKIEELTLYVIEQQKQIDALKARLEENNK